MIRPLERAKMAGSVRLDMADSRRAVKVFFWAAAAVEERCGRRDHSSPPMTSRARVTAKRVRSRVRPP